MDNLFEIDKGWKTKSPYVAVSGGMDSMVMLFYLNSVGIKPKVLHCNFSLRGEESDEDQALVTQFCEENGLEFHFKKFDTPRLKQAQESMQMLCRRLRYDWFDDIVQDGGSVLLAHHFSDQVETLLMALKKRKNLFEFSGIPEVNGIFFRPMLSIEKGEICRYAKKFKVPFREDASNLSNKYERNYLRNVVMPRLSSDFLNRVKQLHYRVLKVKAPWQADFDKWDEKGVIDLRSENEVKLQQYLIRRGFSLDAAIKIVEGKIKNGLKFNDLSARTHETFEGKLYPVSLNKYQEVIINKGDTSFVYTQQSYQVTFNESTTNQSLILLDSDQLQWPLKVRTFSSGDRIEIIGMKGSKKVKDIFKELKIPPDQRFRYFVLEDGEGRILALSTLRRSRYALISDNTKNTLQIF